MKNLPQFFKGKKVLITGHTGFKGGWLSQILLLWGSEVTGIALRPSTTPNLFSLLKIKLNVNNYFIDVRNLKQVKSVFKKHKPEIVFHLAAQPIVRDSYDDPVYTFATNIIGTANILEAIRSTKSVRAAVMVTTDKVYENRETTVPYKEDDRLGGHDPYSSSKASAELVINSYCKSFFNPIYYPQKHSTLIASARAGNVIGGGDWSKDRIMTDIVSSIFEHNKAITIRNPNSVRPWQHVLEPLAGYLSLACHLYKGKKNFSGAWNFGPGQDSHIMVKDLLSKTFDYLGKGSYSISKNSDHKYEASLLVLDSSKARQGLAWKSTISAPKALEHTLDWYNNYYTSADNIKFTNQQIENFFKSRKKSS